MYQIKLFVAFRFHSYTSIHFYFKLQQKLILVYSLVFSYVNKDKLIIAVKIVKPIKHKVLRIVSEID